MARENIEQGSLADSSVVNANFQDLQTQINDVALRVSTAETNILANGGVISSIKVDVTKADLVALNGNVENLQKQIEMLENKLITYQQVAVDVSNQLSSASAADHSVALAFDDSEDTFWASSTQAGEESSSSAGYIGAKGFTDAICRISLKQHNSYCKILILQQSADGIAWENYQTFYTGSNERKVYTFEAITKPYIRLVGGGFKEPEDAEEIEKHWCISDIKFYKMGEQ